MKKFNQKNIELILILIVGLMPLLWFKNSEIILGHDSGLTLYPVSHFLDRLFIWTERFSFGSDQAYALPGFFIHGLEAFVNLLGFNIQNTQKIVFVIWFVLPGLTMFYLAQKLEKKLDMKYFALPASILYMCNHFLLQGWFVAERTKFSLYIALPLVIAFLFDWEEKKKSMFVTSFLIAITFFVFNGEGSLPLYGTVIVTFLAFVIYYLIRNFSIKGLLRLLGLFLSFGVFLLLFNAYWILPFVNFILGSYSTTVQSVGGISAVLVWVDYISRNSSFINIFRLQGIPEWYQNLLHPYANVFLNNPLLILVSFAIPILAFSPLLIIKDPEKRKYIWFFSFLALLSIIFMAGNHAPFGSFYSSLIKYLPGFVAFRTPFYKFASSFWFAYAILIAFTINFLLEKLSKERKKLAFSLYGLFYIGVILYSFPFLNGSFFNYIVGQRSMKVNVPQYIYDFGKWSDSRERINIRTLSLPPVHGPTKFELYNWGFFSPAALASLLTNASIVNKSGYTTPAQNDVLDKLYAQMRENDPEWKNLAKFLGIQSFLLRRDFAWDNSEFLTASPSSFEKALNSSDLTLVNKFGNWEVYDFKDAQDIKKISAYPYTTYIIGKEDDLGMVASHSGFDSKEPIYVLPYSESVKGSPIDKNSKIFIKSDCSGCNLLRKFIDLESFQPLLTRGSIFYPLVEFREKLSEKKAQKTKQTRINYYLYHSLTKGTSLNKVYAEKKTPSIILQVLSDNFDSINKLDKEMDIYLADKNGIDNNFLIEAQDILFYERQIILRLGFDTTVQGSQEELNKTYVAIQNIINKLNKITWRTTDDTNKRLLVNSPVDGEFDLLYRPNDINLMLKGDINFTLNGTKYSAKAEKNKSGWYLLGRFNLSKGQNRLLIEQPIANLYKGSDPWQITSSMNGSCYFTNKIPLTKGDVYRFSFQHKKISGISLFSINYMEKPEAKPLVKSNEFLDSQFYYETYINNWTEYSGREGLYLSICSYPTEGEANTANVIELKDINIRKVDVPDVVAYRPSSAPQNNPVKVDYIKKDQTKYELNIQSDEKKKIYIIFNESYNPNWVLDGLQNNKIVANGLFNGWIVDVNEGSNKAVIKNRTQDLVYAGAKVAIISLIFLSLIYVYLKIKQNEEKN